MKTSTVLENSIKINLKNDRLESHLVIGVRSG